MSSQTFPTLSLERQLEAAGSRFVIGVDEVGRGAIAGPVAVGVALIDFESAKASTPWPAKLRDSKLMSEKARNESVDAVRAWVAHSAVGMASAAEIDAKGIIAALALAASRALDEMLSDTHLRASIASSGATIILDGSHNWLGAKAAGIAVVVRTKADRDCVSVAAASVISKVERDNLMIALDGELPEFGFAGHKGYAAASHIAAVRLVGPSAHHRHSWLGKILADGQLSGLSE